MTEPHVGAGLLRVFFSGLGRTRFIPGLISRKFYGATQLPVCAARCRKFTEGINKNRALHPFSASWLEDHQVSTTMWLTKALCLTVLAGAGLAAPSTKGIYDLLQRRMPLHASSFELSLVDSIGNASAGYDQYVVSSTSKGKILVEGTTLSALSSG